jgi:hypothetical protein
MRPSYLLTICHLTSLMQAREFGEKMHDILLRATEKLIVKYLPPPSIDEGAHDAYGAAPFEADEGWTWVEVEKRLKRAYDEYGFLLWARTAMRAVEPEAKVERVRRQREMDEKAGRGL